MKFIIVSVLLLISVSVWSKSTLSECGAMSAHSSSERIEDYIINISSHTTRKSTYGDLEFEDEKVLLVDAFKTLFIANDTLDKFLNLFGRRAKNTLNYYRSNFPGDNTCNDVICAVSSVWGRELGLKILYIKLKYNFSVSEYIKKDSVRFSSGQLDAIIKGLNDIPKELLSTIQSYGLSKPKIIMGVTDPDWASAVANGAQIKFNSKIHDSEGKATYGHQNSQIKFTLVHELGHLIHMRDGILKAWEKSTGSTCFISEYAKTNSKEDFADSFRAYRYAPETLQSECPEKYQIMKELIFNNKEFIKDRDCQ